MFIHFFDLVYGWSVRTAAVRIRIGGRVGERRLVVREAGAHQTEHCSRHQRRLWVCDLYDIV